MLFSTFTADLPYRWGFGWPYGRFYTPMTQEEEERSYVLLQEYYESTPAPCDDF